MTYKAFKIIGERVLVVDPTHRNKEGIFQNSSHYQTTLKRASRPRPALDFIEPIYNPNSDLEALAREMDPRERIHSENPILSLHLGVNHLNLQYKGQKSGVHIFEGELEFIMGTFLHDGNLTVFNKYKSALKKAGFDIE